MPWGILSAGFYGSWGNELKQWFDQLCSGSKLKTLDFVLADTSGQPMNYATFLRHLRRLLVTYGELDDQSANRYTVHSLKATVLSWALQVGLDETTRKFMGHHRLTSGSSRVAATYSRDDVLPALRGQAEILKAFRNNFMPMAPQMRGGQAPIFEKQLSHPVNSSLKLPSFLTGQLQSSTATLTTSDDESSSSSSASDSECEKTTSASSHTDHQTHEQTGWIINSKTHRYHKAISKGGTWFRACCTSEAPPEHMKFSKSDPAFDEVTCFPCKNQACFP
jgi:hypothetical protein